MCAVHEDHKSVVRKPISRTVTVPATQPDRVVKFSRIRIDRGQFRYTAFPENRRSNGDTTPHESHVGTTKRHTAPGTSRRGESGRETVIMVRPTQAQYLRRESRKARVSRPSGHTVPGGTTRICTYSPLGRHAGRPRVALE